MRRLLSEFLGTAFLLAAVVGSGIMGWHLSDGDPAMALLANSVATAAALVALIFTFGPISGAHFNPAVTLAMCLERSVDWRALPGYVASQLAGAVVGVGVAHAMFDLPLVQIAERHRSGTGQLVSEFVATFGLVLVIHGTGKRSGVVPLTVAAYIAAAYWFTASTSFANPAVTVARALTRSFAGIRPTDVLPFIGAQIVAAVAATYTFRLIGNRSDS